MIPAEPGAYVAHYRQENNGTGNSYFSTKKVVAWDEDGAAQVLDPRTGRLVDASSYSNFARVIEADTAAVVGAIPGGGWLAEHRADDGTTYTCTLVAWNVRADGTLDPVCVDDIGVGGDPSNESNFVRLYLPSDEPVAPAG